MHDSFSPAWISKMAARNDPEKIRFHLTLRFSMLYFVLFALGILLCRRTWLGSLSVWQTNIQALLASPFTECVRARDYIRVLLRCSRFEMMLLAMLTVSGMTYFSRTASGALLAAHAFLFGCMSCRLLTDLLAGNPATPHGNLVFFVYFFAKWIQAAILLAVAAEAVCFSYEYRDAGRALRAKQNNIVVQFSLCAVSYAGILLIARTMQTLLMAFLLRLR